MYLMLLFCLLVEHFLFLRNLFLESTPEKLCCLQHRIRFAPVLSNLYQLDAIIILHIFLINRGIQLLMQQQKDYHWERCEQILRRERICISLNTRYTATMPHGAGSKVRLQTDILTRSVLTTDTEKKARSQGAGSRTSSITDPSRCSVAQWQ